MAFSVKFSSIRFLHNFVFIFHLAILIFVAGFFSKIDLDQPIKTFKRILLPYILVTIIYWIVYLPFGKPSPAIFIYPTYALWFLMALFLMKMALPILNKLKYPLLFSFFLALCFGFIKYDGDILGLSRTFVFLSAFLIGFYFKDYKLKVKEDYGKIMALLENDKFILVLSAVSFTLSILVAYCLPLNTIMMRYPYESPYLINILIRALIILLGIAITLILNRFMTNRECFLTKWGRNSMAIYIFHIFFVLILKKTTESFLYQQNEIIAVLFTLIVSLIIVWILSSDWISEYFNRITEACANLILKE